MASGRGGGRPRPLGFRPSCYPHRGSRTGERQLIEIKDKSTGAILHQVDAKRLDKANLAGLMLRCADFSSKSLSFANLRQTDLVQADFSFANLSSADLTDAVLWRATLNCTMLISALLGNCDLREAILRNASLYQADLRGATLEGAILLGTDLTGVDLSETALGGAVYNRHTRWPTGFDPETEGAVLKE